jgi:biotin transport system substrate-specific component
LPGLSTRDITYSALFVALIATGALFTIALGPVPFTLQVGFVLLAGLVIGPRLGALSVLGYLCLGLIAPVFAGGASGPAVLVGPTAGYLWGFLPAVVIAGLIARGGQPSTRRYTLAALAGLVPIYGLGATWLAAQQHLPAGVALSVGVLQFLPVDVLKAIAAGLVARSLVSLPLGLPGLSDR